MKVTQSCLFVTPRSIHFMELNNGVGSCSLLQGIFPTRGSNPGHPHCRWILYQLSHKGRPRTLEWVASPFPADLPDPGIELGSPALQMDSLPAELFIDFSVRKEVCSWEGHFFPSSKVCSVVFVVALFFGHTRWQVQDLSFSHQGSRNLHPLQ